MTLSSLHQMLQEVRLATLGKQQKIQDLVDAVKMVQGLVENDIKDLQRQKQLVDKGVPLVQRRREKKKEKHDVVDTPLIDGRDAKQPGCDDSNDRVGAEGSNMDKVDQAEGV